MIAFTAGVGIPRSVWWFVPPHHWWQSPSENVSEIHSILSLCAICVHMGQMTMAGFRNCIVTMFLSNTIWLMRLVFFHQLQQLCIFVGGKGPLFRRHFVWFCNACARTDIHCIRLDTIHNNRSLSYSVNCSLNHFNVAEFILEWNENNFMTAVYPMASEPALLPTFMVWRTRPPPFFSSHLIEFSCWQLVCFRALFVETPRA
jgi:hypothetical protein